MPFPFAAAAAGLGAVGNFVGGLVNSRRAAKQSRANIKQTNEGNLKMADYQYSKDLEMWNKQNEYNSPEMQMQRFREAGLNPNLIYGQGNAGNAASMPKYNAPTQDYSKELPVMLPELLGQFQDFALKQAQIKNVNAATFKTEQEGAYLDKTMGHRAKIVESKGKRDWVEYISKSQNDGWGRRAKADLETKEAAALFSKYRNEWEKLGIRSADNIMLRMFSRQLIESGFDFKSIFKKR